MTGFPEGYVPVRLGGVDSTNEEAKRRAAAGGAVNGQVLVITATEQISGRARRGRGWVSPPGNLYCSLLLCPDLPAAQVARLGYVAALAVREAVAGALPDGPAVTCKWPNDVLVGGHKVAGILMETSGNLPGPPDWLVIGIGINVAHHPAGTEYPATSLKAAGAGTADPDTLLQELVSRFDAWHRILAGAGFAPVRQAWLDAAHGRGRAITVRAEHGSMQGIFTDLDDDGAMLLGTGGGIRRVLAGDVMFAPPA